MDSYKLDLIYVGLSVISHGYDNIRLTKLITDIGNHRALVKKKVREGVVKAAQQVRLQSSIVTMVHCDSYKSTYFESHITVIVFVK